MLGMTETIGVDDYDDPPMPIPLDSPDALAALDRLAKHVPPEIHIPRPMMAIYNPPDRAVQFVTASGVFSVYSASADRLASIGNTLWTELTEFCGGRETSRTTRKIADLQRPPD